MLSAKRMIALFPVFLSLATSSLALRCYICDSTSDVGYFDAEKDCNTETSLRQCPDTKHKACMIEAFRHHDSGQVSFHIIKRCLSDCPVSINGSAEHTRCCVRDECNEVISIDFVVDSLPHAKSMSSSSGATGSGSRFSNSRRMEPSMDQRSGSSFSSAENNREPIGDRHPPGGPQSSFQGPPAESHGQPSRSSNIPGAQQHDENVSGGGRPFGEGPNLPNQNSYAGGRGGQPPMLLMTTHAASPTLVAPGQGRHGDGSSSSSRTKASGQSINGAIGNRQKGNVASTWVTLSTTAAMLATSMFHQSRRIL